MWYDIVNTERILPDGLELDISDITGLTIITKFDRDIRLLRKRTLANDYGEYWDLHGNRYYVSPEAEKVSRLLWIGVEVDRDFYIYLKEDE